MVNLLKTLNDYLKTNITGLKVYNDLFPDDSTEGIISVHDPSTRKIEEYIDGTALFQLNVSYSARYKDAKKSREILDKILNLLDKQKLLDSYDNLKLKINTVANVQFVGITDNNFSIYTCSVVVEYRKSNV